MSRYHSYINTAKNLIETYKGETPFATFQKQFFAANKKYGAKDRRNILSLCYNYFRLGFAAGNIALNKKLLLATFLCETEPSLLLENLQPEWNENISLSIAAKAALLDEPFHLDVIFPFADELSDGIVLMDFCHSFLVQPDLFIRIRPKTFVSVLKKLERSKLHYHKMGDTCIQLDTAEKLEELFIIDKEVVVQDYNSQRVLDYLKNHELPCGPPASNTKEHLMVWDCCAASGGKSILLYDMLRRKIDLTVSDIRATIILILHQRFKKAVIKEYKYFIADITAASFKPGDLNFDLIVCDVPCTGSGTWSRTPEQLCFFNTTSIEEYNGLQKRIVTKVLPHLKKNGLFFYITCSVFKKENEEMAKFIAANLNCELLHQQLLTGYNEKADTMFVAVLKKL